MKFKLYKELLNKSDIMYHVFLNCINDEDAQKMVNENKYLTDNEIENREIDIELKINGTEYNPRNFFSSIWEQYEKLIQKEVTKIIKNQTSEKLRTIQSKLQEYEEICESLSNDINWNISLVRNKMKIITLCGSTKFKEQFIAEQKRLTLEGNIVISVGLFGHSGDNEVWTEGTKEMLDEMHKRKIDLADEIFVINVDGYIGSSTKNEIEYAKENNKIIKYLVDIKN